MTDTLFSVPRLDPATGLDGLGSLPVRDGRIADLGDGIGRPDSAEIIDGDGAVLRPSLVDMRAAVRMAVLDLLSCRDRCHER